MNFKKEQLIKMNWPFTVNHNSPQAIGLDAWWPCFNGPSGKRIYDLVGNHHAEANTGNIAWRPARPYGYIAPSLTSQGLRAATYTKALNDFTITCWFNSTGQDNVFDRVFDKGQATGVLLFLNNGGTGEYKSIINGSTSSGVVLPFNQAYFVAVRRIGTGAAIIVDGGRIKSTWTPGSTATDTTNFIIGSNQFFSNTFGGCIWDVRIYSRGLSDDELLAMYNQDTRFDLLAPLGIEALGSPTASAPPPTTGNSQVIWFM